MTTIQINLPDQLAQEAQRAGLLSPARLEKCLRDQLQAQHVNELFAAMDRMAAVVELPVMSPEEVAAELTAMRARPRAKMEALVGLASLDELVFEEGVRGPSDDLRLQFEAVSHMPEDERRIVKALLEGMIMKYQTRQMVGNLNS